MPLRRTLLQSATASLRIRAATEWLASHPNDAELLVIGANLEGANDLIRAHVREKGGALFGIARWTLPRFAASMASSQLASRGLATVAQLGIEALSARVVHLLRRDGQLGRFVELANRPGLPRALARTFDELRMSGVTPLELVDTDLLRAYAVFVDELTRSQLADRATVFRVATERLRHQETFVPPFLLLDVRVSSAVEREFVAALAEKSGCAFATVPSGDQVSIEHLERALSVRCEAGKPDPGENESAAVARVQARLFAKDLARSGHAEMDETLTILSAPGESRECVEIARAIQEQAEKGVAFDRMAVALRAPELYRPHLEEALRRASIPAHFARGVLRPDPSGRALLALLSSAVEGLSARRFAEYLSLGQVPELTETGAPPNAAESSERWSPPDEELMRPLVELGSAEGNGTATSDQDVSLPAPRYWERLLVDSAVIGGANRWRRRLAGLRAEYAVQLAALEEPDGPSADRIRRSIREIEALSRFALPLVDDLGALPKSATWGVWIDRISALATRALKQPERVLAVLAELLPMADSGPVDLSEVRLVLGRRMSHLVVPAEGRKYGRVYVAHPEDLRGLSFDVVLVPGMAEKVFPQKVIEDPLLRDVQRRAISAPLTTNVERVENERMMLRLALGAATKKIVISFPRVDVEQARPRTPSFYGLEIVRAAEGTLPGFDELGRRAETASEARLGWPAPPDPIRAIDEAEHDLALLDLIFRKPEAEERGVARYLLTANPHLARALRFRAARWRKGWFRADGLVDPSDAARQALSQHSFESRSYSATALQNYAACPYRFFLQAIWKLAPREESGAIEELDPLQRGSLIHDVLFEFSSELRAENRLPLRALEPSQVDAIRAQLDNVLDRVATRYHENLAPAIDRVWEDGIAGIRADLREWLAREIQSQPWSPIHFELSFGLESRLHRDPASRPDPVLLDDGLLLRGSIDCVERDERGIVRAVDYKTGKRRVEAGTVIGGGQVLQPAMYALALEKLLGVAVAEGVLYYSTFVGEFERVGIALDERARKAVRLVIETVKGALDEGFLPAAPEKNGCDYCDYRVVCGPYEVQRTGLKRQDRLLTLRNLRSER